MSKHGSEQRILNDLITKWVSLAREYIADAPDIRAFYLYGSHEREGNSGQIFADVLFDQAGEVRFKSRIAGGSTEMSRMRNLLRLLTSDLMEATSAFDAAGIPAPTEYRVYYEPQSGKLDVQLSRKIRFLGNDELTQSDGFRLWLGSRTPEL